MEKGGDSEAEKVDGNRGTLVAIKSLNPGI